MVKAVLFTEKIQLKMFSYFLKLKKLFLSGDCAMTQV